MNAIEIIQCFKSLEDLSILKETSLKLMNEIPESKKDMPQLNNKCQSDFIVSHKNYINYWIFPDNFPCSDAYNSYSKPFIIEDYSAISWRNPDFVKLRNYCKNELKSIEKKPIQFLNELEEVILKLGNN